MSIAEPPLQRLRMSWEEYLALPDDVRAEWVAGEVVVSPPVGPPHGVAALRLGSVLTVGLPGLILMTEVGLRLPGDRLRAPDLMAVIRLPAEGWVTEAPVLVVEVLSPGTRVEDTLVKGPEYAAAGVGQYWLLDPDARSLDVFVNDDGRWRQVLHLDAGAPTGEVVVGDHGTVVVDLPALLPPE